MTDYLVKMALPFFAVLMSEHLVWQTGGQLAAVGISFIVAICYPPYKSFGESMNELVQGLKLLETSIFGLAYYFAWVRELDMETFMQPELLAAIVLATILVLIIARMILNIFFCNHGHHHHTNTNASNNSPTDQVPLLTQKDGIP